MVLLPYSINIIIFKLIYLYSLWNSIHTLLQGTSKNTMVYYYVKYHTEIILWYHIQESCCSGFIMFVCVCRGPSSLKLWKAIAVRTDLVISASVARLWMPLSRTEANVLSAWTSLERPSCQSESSICHPAGCAKPSSGSPALTWWNSIKLIQNKWTGVSSQRKIAHSAHLWQPWPATSVLLFFFSSVVFSESLSKLLVVSSSPSLLLLYFSFFSFQNRGVCFVTHSQTKGYNTQRAAHYRKINPGAKQRLKTVPAFRCSPYICFEHRNTSYANAPWENHPIGVRRT